MKHTSSLLKRALLVGLFAAAFLLLFCEPAAGAEQPLALILFLKGAGLLAFSLGAYLLRRWKSQLGIGRLID